MKKGILILAITFIGSIANAQKISESEVPASVKEKFTSLYPKCKVEKWVKEEGNFEAEFDKNKTEMSVVIDPTGKLIETETTISIASLPKAVSDYVAKNHAGKKITEAAKITSADGTVTYEAEVKEVELYFDSNGAFLRSEKEKGKG